MLNDELLHECLLSEPGLIIVEYRISSVPACAMTLGCTDRAETGSCSTKLRCASCATAFGTLQGSAEGFDRDRAAHALAGIQVSDISSVDLHLLVYLLAGTLSHLAGIEDPVHLTHSGKSATLLVTNEATV